MGFQPASHLAARLAHLWRRKAVGESTHLPTERMEDRAALTQVEMNGLRSSLVLMYKSSQSR